jgi:DNA-binding transcriptional LysR family regulator
MAFRRGHLEYFVAVAEEGQITSAARRLGVAQPALSQAIAQLESETGLRLLERHARGVKLTPAGESFYAKARLAVAATGDALSAARSLARAQQGTIEFGFLGAPPSIEGRMEMEGFAMAYPDIEVRYRDLPFPTRSTSAWMRDVDVAACHEPPPDEAVWMKVIRHEPRIALVPSGHPLAEREELEVAELLDETFIGFGPTVDPAWAGFWSLDDHRGGPPRLVTGDGACNPQEVLAALGGTAAITIVPRAAANVLSNVLTDIAAIPLRGASSSRIALVGHRDRRNQLVAALLSYADVVAAAARAEDDEDSRAAAG